MRGSFKLLLLLITVLISACNSPPIVEQAAPEPVVTPFPRVAAAETKIGGSVQLGFHYKPLGDGTPDTQLADQAAFMILTKNDEEYRDQLRAAGYKGRILQYVLGSEVDGPAVKKGKNGCDPEFAPYQNQVANQPGDFCKLLQENEDWFLHNSKGQRLYNTYKDRRYYHMNPASKGWREFVLARLKQRMFGDATTPPLGYDGIFLDNVELTWDKARSDLTNSDGKIKEFQSNEDFRAAWKGYLKFLREGLGPDVPIWGNMIASNYAPDEWNAYLPYLDGGMNEAFITGYSTTLSVEKQNNELRQAEYVIGQGKGFYAIGQGDQSDTQRQQFALAAYLLITKPGAPVYFRYTRANQWYGEWWMYDNYQVDLGEPTGARYAVQNGWRRNFTKGYVMIDQQKRKGFIVQYSLNPSAAPSSP